MTDEIPAEVSELPTLRRLVRQVWAADGCGETAQAAADAVISVGGLISARVCILRSDGAVEFTAVSGTWVSDPAGTRRRRPWQRVGQPARADRDLVDRAGCVIGTLSVRTASDTGIGQQQDQLLDTFAFQLGLAIDHARLAERLQRAHSQVVAERAERLVSDQTWHVAFDEAPIGMSLLGLHRGRGAFLRVNDALCQLTGHSAAQLTAMTVVDLTHPGDRAPIAAALRRAAEGRRTPSTLQLRYLHRSGRTVWVRMTTSPVFDDERQPLHAIGHIEPLDGQVPSQAGLSEAEPAAGQNPLTSRLHRAALTTTVSTTLDRARRNATTAAVMMCDLQALDAHIAQHSPQQAAELTAQIGRQLRRALRPEDVVGRIDDTTLAVVLEELTAADAQAIAQRVRIALHGQPGADGDSLRVETSIGIGISMIDNDCADADAVLRDASTALLRARPTGPGTHQRYRTQPTGPDQAPPSSCGTGPTPKDGLPNGARPPFGARVVPAYTDGTVAAAAEGWVRDDSTRARGRGEPERRATADARPQRSRQAQRPYAAPKRPRQPTPRAGQSLLTVGVSAVAVRVQSTDVAGCRIVVNAVTAVRVRGLGEMLRGGYHVGAVPADQRGEFLQRLADDVLAAVDQRHDRVRGRLSAFDEVGIQRELRATKSGQL